MRTVVSQISLASLVTYGRLPAHWKFLHGTTKTDLCKEPDKDLVCFSPNSIMAGLDGF